MVNVKVVEKEPRVFIPYDIIITVESKDDHNELMMSARQLKDKDNYFWKKIGSLGSIADKILAYKYNGQ